MPRKKKPDPGATGTQVVSAKHFAEARRLAAMTQFDVSTRVREQSGGAVQVLMDEISRLENGSGRDIAGSKVRALALALGCSTDYLLGLSAKPKG